MTATHFVQKSGDHVTSKLGNRRQRSVMESRLQELEVVPPEGQSVWDASCPWADQTGCQVAVPNTEGSGWVGKRKGGEELDKRCLQQRRR